MIQALLATTLVLGTMLPCAIAPQFARLHAAIFRLNDQLTDGERIARRLHHTTRRYGYHTLERLWTTIVAETKPLLDEVTDISIALDASADTPQKRAALTLVAAYHNGLEHHIDHVRAIVYYERTNATLSTFIQRREYLEFGVSADALRAGRDTSAHYSLDEAATRLLDLTQPRPATNTTLRPWESPSGGYLDAILGMTIEEHRYALTCAQS